MRVYIYALVERSTGYLIYVGRTSRSPEQREREHRRTYRGITDIDLVVLDEVPPSESPSEHEWWWLHELERRGHRFLTNVRLCGSLPRGAQRPPVADEVDAPKLARVRGRVTTEWRRLGLL